MRWVTLLALGVLAAAGCQGSSDPTESTEPAAAAPAAPATSTAKAPATPAEPRFSQPVARPFDIKLILPDNPVTLVYDKDLANPREVTPMELVEILQTRRQALKDYERVSVRIKADPDIAYEALARTFLVCGRANVEDVSVNDVPTRLPVMSDPAPKVQRQPAPKPKMKGKSEPKTGDTNLWPNIPTAPAGPPPPLQAFHIRLLDAESGGDYDPGKTNAECVIMVESGTPVKDFDALQTLIEKMKGENLTAETMIVLQPTMGCRIRWVLKAATTVRSAGLNRLVFAVPYN